MVHSVSGWTRGVQVKLWDPLRTRAIPERLRGAFTTRRYRNPRLPYLSLHTLLHSVYTSLTGSRQQVDKVTVCDISVLSSPSTVDAVRDQGRNHGWKVEGDQGLGPNTGAQRRTLSRTQHAYARDLDVDRRQPADHVGARQRSVPLGVWILMAAPPSSQQLWSAGFFCGRPCDMELVTRQSERSGHQQRLLQAFTEDVFIFSALELFGRCALQIYLLNYLMYLMEWYSCILSESVQLALELHRISREESLASTTDAWHHFLTNEWMNAACKTNLWFRTSTQVFEYYFTSIRLIGLRNTSHHWRHIPISWPRDALICIDINVSNVTRTMQNALLLANP